MDARAAPPTYLPDPGDFYRGVVQFHLRLSAQAEGQPVILTQSDKTGPMSNAERQAKFRALRKVTASVTKSNEIVTLPLRSVTGKGGAIGGDSSILNASLQHNTRENKANTETKTEEKTQYGAPASVTARNEIVTPTVTKSNARNRRENAPDPTMPAILDTPEFRQAWSDFRDHRLAKRAPLTAKAIDLIFADLSKYPAAVAVEALQRAVAGGWTGVFPESVRQGGKPQPATDQAAARKARLDKIWRDNP